MNTSSPPYRGRFAPSPTGPLHLGSLVAALGSYLQAKSNNGLWLLRMEDLDSPREMPGAADEILRSLENHGLLWDESVIYQSQRSDLYERALQQLAASHNSFACSCSRKIIAAQQTQLGIDIYPGLCRNAAIKQTSKTAIRVKTTATNISFDDLLQGYYQQNLQSEVGDFVIKRADGYYAYQLAVVVDDAAQNITQVVRGCDLLSNTPRQIFLQQLLALATPQYAHLPVIINLQGEKLSKQTHAAPLDNQQASLNLVHAMLYLGLQPADSLARESCQTLLQWATEHWRLMPLMGVKSCSLTNIEPS